MTNPSTSPENFPLAPGNVRFFDEVTGSMTNGTTLVAGSTIDMQIVNDLFASVGEAAAVLGCGRGPSRTRLVDARARLAPMQIGHKGDLQEWLDDWEQREASHRHISSLYGLYPGPPDHAPAHARLRRGQPRRPRAARADGKRLVVGLEGGRVGAPWRRRAQALENIAYAANALHDGQPVLDLFEGAAGGRGARHDGGDRRAAPPV